MKKLLSLFALLALSLGFSSCCSLFGSQTGTAGYRTTTKQVKTCGYDIVTEQVNVGGSKSGKGGMIETIEKKVPRYKTVTKKTRVPCNQCVRLYCPKKDCCGSTSEAFLKMSTAQGPVGSPHIGLVPTMRKLAE
ncbi:hypothetical protein HZ994_10835 [Akkermansiaceae bacterium]|nr:hypothetical protein HZ994_10835 [Akkermansiaceae bacterium]